LEPQQETKVPKVHPLQNFDFDSEESSDFEEEFSMMDLLKKQRQLKEQKKREELEHAGDEPAQKIPTKDLKRLQDVEKTKNVQDTIKKEKEKRAKEQPEKKEAPEDEGTLFDQMKRRKKAKEDELRKKDEEKAREDPNYKPHFKPRADGAEEPEPKDSRGTTPAERKAFDDKVLRKRLHEERRKHFPDMQRKMKEHLDLLD